MEFTTGFRIFRKKKKYHKFDNCNKFTFTFLIKLSIKNLLNVHFFSRVQLTQQIFFLKFFNFIPLLIIIFNYNSFTKILFLKNFF